MPANIDNRPLLEAMFQDGVIRMERGSILDLQPALPISGDVRDRIEGMLLGVAIGDALGATSESMLPAVRRKHFGEIREYLPNRYAAMKCVGLPTDDSQLTFWTVEQVLADGGLVPEHLANRFAQDRIFGIGRTVTEFLRRYKEAGFPWREAGVNSAGNGALMRISPIILPHLRSPSPALWADAAIAGMITHNDAASNATCVAFVRILWDAFCITETPPRGWWLDAYGQSAMQLEGDTRYRSRDSAIPFDYEGPLWRFTKHVVEEALSSDVSVHDACNRWYSGAYLLETVPSVLYILEKHAADPEEAIIRAVNDTRDNDTIASIVGAALGALHGNAAWPRRWVDGLLGRTGEKDDGRVFQLIEESLKYSP